MALGIVQQISGTGLAPAYAVPLATENIVPDDDLFLHIKNTSGTAVTLTIVDPSLTQAGSASINPTVAIPITTGDKMVYLNKLLQNTTTGLIQVTFSAQPAGLTAALLRM